MANLVTIARIALVPVFFFLILLGSKSSQPIAFFIFLLAALTDLLDGFIARRIGRVTELGRLADPFADRLLIVGAIVALFFKGAIPLWAFAVLIGRDLLMIAGYVLLKATGRPLPKISLFGKITNFFLMGAIVLLVFQIAFFKVFLFEWPFYLGILLYLLSGLVYIVQGVESFLGWGGESEPERKTE